MPQIEKQMPDSYSGGRETYKNDIFGKIFLKNFDKKMRFRHPFKLVPKIFLPTDLLSRQPPGWRLLFFGQAGGTLMHLHRIWISAATAPIRKINSSKNSWQKMY